MAHGKYKIVFTWTISFLLVLLMLAQGPLLDQYFYNYYVQDGWNFFNYASRGCSFALATMGRNTRRESLDRTAST